MRRNFSDSKGFSLIELLVVITILAIISTVAYTSFSGATDKAKNSKRVENLASIETALQAFKQEKQYYPMPSAKSATNYWGYDNAASATTKNTLTVVKSGDNITGVTAATTIGGGKVMDTAGTNQVGAKGTIDSTVLSKQYLSQDLMDPGLKDVKVGSTQTLSDFGIGRYVYGVYAKAAVPASWNTDTKGGLAYNLATTLLDEQKGPVTKITGDFDDKYGNCNGTCPVSLIGPGGATANLQDGATTDVPYQINGF